MGLIKCPRCELNYMPDTERYCTVCKREMRGEETKEDIELCPECGEHPVVPGEELCAYCLKEVHRQERTNVDAVNAEDVGELDEASGMNEIDIAIDKDIPSAEFKEINRELQIERDEDDDDDLDEDEEEDDLLVVDPFDDDDPDDDEDE